MRTRYISLYMRQHAVHIDVPDGTCQPRLTNAVRHVGVRASQPEIGILFNNTGICVPKLEDAFAVNAHSVACVAEAFLEAMRPCDTRYVIFSSSRAVRVPYCGVKAYSASKAAADMWNACLVEEHADVRVLRYSPKSLETNMMCIDVARQAASATLKNNGSRFLDPVESANMLMELLAEDKFESGKYIDFFETA
eukprot:IDg4645t1